MNIFVLSRDPVLAAQHMCDKHVVKMPTEGAQMLCTTLSMHGYYPLYRPTHVNHPCTRWTSTSLQNWEWLLVHTRALLEEYKFRYGKTHATSHVVDLIERVHSRFILLPNVGLTDFVQAMPMQYRQHDTVKAYRDFYVHEKTFARWNKARSAPSWWVSGAASRLVATESIL